MIYSYPASPPSVKLACLGMAPVGTRLLGEAARILLSAAILNHAPYDVSRDNIT